MRTLIHKFVELWMFCLLMEFETEKDPQSALSTAGDVHSLFPTVQAAKNEDFRHKFPLSTTPTTTTVLK
ncbi:MAG TPA: hypothetical protein DD727_06610 [Clostridiales bacterium]|nr:hypothetical protein [Clostridiales bacterium]